MHVTAYAPKLEKYRRKNPRMESDAQNRKVSGRTHVERVLITFRFVGWIIPLVVLAVFAVVAIVYVYSPAVLFILSSRSSLLVSTLCSLHRHPISTILLL